MAIVEEVAMDEIIVGVAIAEALEAREREGHLSMWNRIAYPFLCLLHETKIPHRLVRFDNPLD